MFHYPPLSLLHDPKTTHTHSLTHTRTHPRTLAHSRWGRWPLGRWMESQKMDMGMVAKAKWNDLWSGWNFCLKIFIYVQLKRGALSSSDRPLSLSPSLSFLSHTHTHTYFFAILSQSLSLTSTHKLLWHTLSHSLSLASSVEITSWKRSRSWLEKYLEKFQLEWQIEIFVKIFNNCVLIDSVHKSIWRIKIKFRIRISST